jgi:hypothetical protein
MKLFLKFSMYDDPKAGRVIVHAINQWIYGRLRMLTQFQKYEVGKLESSETKLYFGPEIWTYVGENGEIMPTKKLYQAAKYYSLDEHGELQRHGAFEGAKHVRKNEARMKGLDEQNDASKEGIQV